MAEQTDFTPQISLGSTDRLAAIRHALEKDGFAVLPGVLTAQECEENIAQLHKWLAKFGDDFPDNKGSLIHSYNIAHHPVAWSVRLKAAHVFQSLFGTEKLASSFDGVAIGRPPVLPEDGSLVPAPAMPPNKGARNLHLDQGGDKKGRHAFQGAVYLEETHEDDWCLAVMSRSHHHHDEFFADSNSEPRPKSTTPPPPDSEFRPLTEAEIAWYKERGCEIQRIPVPKGGMVLWDSRVVHAGAPPLVTRQNPERWRYVVFVCMVPAAWASAEEMAQKKEAFNKLSCSRHWPAQGFETFENTPVPSELQAVNELPEIAKTDEVRLLAGDLEYDFNDGTLNGPAKPLVL